MFFMDHLNKVILMSNHNLFFMNHLNKVILSNHNLFFYWSSQQGNFNE